MRGGQSHSAGAEAPRHSLGLGQAGEHLGHRDGIPCRGEGEVRSRGRVVELAEHEFAALDALGEAGVRHDLGGGELAGASLENESLGPQGRLARLL